MQSGSACWKTWSLTEHPQISGVRETGETGDVRTESVEDQLEVAAADRDGADGAGGIWLGVVFDAAHGRDQWPALQADQGDDGSGRRSRASGDEPRDHTP